MGKLISIGKTTNQVRRLHAKHSLSYFYQNFIKDPNTLVSTVEQMHLENQYSRGKKNHDNLIKEIKMNHVIAGEQAVIANLKRLGLIKEEDKDG